jgi:hypothetical protein
MPRLLETLRFEKVGINVVVFFGVLFGIFVLGDSGKIYDVLDYFSLRIERNQRRRRSRGPACHHA